MADKDTALAEELVEEEKTSTNDESQTLKDILEQSDEADNVVEEKTENIQNDEETLSDNTEKENHNKSTEPLTEETHQAETENESSKEDKLAFLKPQKVKTEKNIKNEFVLKFVILAILISTAFGMAGAYLFNYYFGAGIVHRGNVVINTVEKTENTITEGLSENSVPVVVEKTKNSVVAITTSTLANSPVMGQYVTEGAGSGVIISEDGYIVTNTHVVQNTNNIMVRLFNNKEYKATIVGEDVASDLTVIKIDVEGLTPAKFGLSDDLIVGQTVIAIGNPLGELGGTVTSGIISAKDRELTINSQSMTLLQFSAAVNPGNSGGGLFNLNGELVGVVNAKTSGSEVEGLGFAIPSTYALDIITQLVETGKVSGRPQLGVTIVEVQNMNEIYTFVNDEIYPFLDSTGLYIVDSVSPHLFLGDKIIAIDGASMNTMDDVKKCIDKKAVGDKVEITISRNKKIVTLEIELTEKS